MVFDTDKWTPYFRKIQLPTDKRLLPSAFPPCSPAVRLRSVRDLHFVSTFQPFPQCLVRSSTLPREGRCPQSPIGAPLVAEGFSPQRQQEPTDHPILGTKFPRGPIPPFRPSAVLPFCPSASSAFFLPSPPEPTLLPK